MFRPRFLYAALTSILAILLHIDSPAQSVNRSQTIKEIDALRKQFIEKEKLFLSPSAEDQAAFAQFLKQPNTGMIRLFPAGLYRDLLLTAGDGSLYSFTRSAHDYRGGSIDIGFGPVYRKPNAPPPVAENGFHPMLCGFIVTLGDIPLEKVTLDHDGLKFLVAYDPPSTSPEHSADRQRAIAGVAENGYEYKWEIPATVNSTYALRSINYGRSDILVAFRVVRKERDGSVVILWKMLKRFSTPSRLR